MSENDELKSLYRLTDDELIHRLSEVLAQSRRVEWVLVAHIAEVDARRLYAREGFPSMFQYCVDGLHLSESEAYRRITAARASRTYPVILEMLADGRLHLAGVTELKAHLTDANYEDVLARATHKTKRQIKELVAELAPKPDVPATIRKRPDRQPKPQAQAQPQTPASPSELRPGAVASKPATPTRPATVEPLAPARYKVEFTADQELRDKLQRLARLMPGNDLASIIDAAVTEKLERVEARRFGKVSSPRKDLEDADTSPGTRGVSAAVRRFVWERDAGQCVFVSSIGKRCPETEQLEFHHIEAFGKGGGRGADNICLMCRAHNAYMAELDYGQETMSRFRRSADRVREPVPTFGRLPDKVA
jgi:hypothetical protein